MAQEKEPQALEAERHAAERALAAAQGMPGGAQRAAALREAGQLRFAASEKIRHLAESLSNGAKAGSTRAL